MTGGGTGQADDGEAGHIRTESDGTRQLYLPDPFDIPGKFPWINELQDNIM